MTVYASPPATLLDTTPETGETLVILTNRTNGTPYRRGEPVIYLGRKEYGSGEPVAIVGPIPGRDYDDAEADAGGAVPRSRLVHESGGDGPGRWYVSLSAVAPWSARAEHGLSGERRDAAASLEPVDLATLEPGARLVLRQRLSGGYGEMGEPATYVRRCADVCAVVRVGDDAAGPMHVAPSALALAPEEPAEAAPAEATEAAEADGPATLAEALEALEAARREAGVLAERVRMAEETANRARAEHESDVRTIAGALKDAARSEDWCENFEEQVTETAEAIGGLSPIGAEALKEYARRDHAWSVRVPFSGEVTVTVNAPTEKEAQALAASDLWDYADAEAIYSAAETVTDDPEDLSAYLEQRDV